MKHISKKKLLKNGNGHTLLLHLMMEIFREVSGEGF